LLSSDAYRFDTANVADAWMATSGSAADFLDGNASRKKVQWLRCTQKNLDLQMKVFNKTSSDCPEMQNILHSSSSGGFVHDPSCADLSP